MHAAVKRQPKKIAYRWDEMRVEDTAREQGKDRYRHGDREHGQEHVSETGLETGLGARTETGDK